MTPAPPSRSAGRDLWALQAPGLGALGGGRLWPRLLGTLSVAGVAALMGAGVGDQLRALEFWTDSPMGGAAVWGVALASALVAPVYAWRGSWRAPPGSRASPPGRWWSGAVLGPLGPSLAIALLAPLLIFGLTALYTLVIGFFLPGLFSVAAWLLPIGSWGQQDWLPLPLSVSVTEPAPWLRVPPALLAPPCAWVIRGVLAALGRLFPS